MIPSVVLSSLLVTLQAFSLNSILINNKALPQNTYLPAACYVLILSSSPEFMMLSPALCAITFVLIGINYMLFHLQYRGSEENILSTGFLFGLAILFHPPAILFIVLIYGIYLAYSSTLNRRYLLIAFGIILPFIMIWLYFLWQGQGAEFWLNLAQSLGGAERQMLIPIDELLVLMALPMLIMVVSASQTFAGIGLTNHQIVTQRTWVLLLLFGVGSVFLNDKISSNSVIYFAPTLAFFITQFLLSRERKWLPELIFIVLLLWSLGFLLLPKFVPELLPIDYSMLK